MYNILYPGLKIQLSILMRGLKHDIFRTYNSFGDADLPAANHMYIKIFKNSLLEEDESNGYIFCKKLLVVIKAQKHTCIVSWKGPSIENY